MGCACGSDRKVNLVYACSGAANTGNLADQAARKLASVGFGSMTCLAAVGADLSGFIPKRSERSGTNLLVPFPSECRDRKVEIPRPLGRNGGTKCLGSRACPGVLIPFIVSAKNADKNIVIDGCPVACGAKIFQEKGLSFDHFITTEFGVAKGKTSITQELIADVAVQIAQRM